MTGPNDNAATVELIPLNPAVGWGKPLVGYRFLQFYDKGNIVTNFGYVYHDKDDHFSTEKYEAGGWQPLEGFDPTKPGSVNFTVDGQTLATVKYDQNLINALNSLGISVQNYLSACATILGKNPDFNFNTPESAQALSGLAIGMLIGTSDKGVPYSNLFANPLTPELNVESTSKLLEKTFPNHPDEVAIAKSALVDLDKAAKTGQIYSQTEHDILYLICVNLSVPQFVDEMNADPSLIPSMVNDIINSYTKPRPSNTPPLVEAAVENPIVPNEAYRAPLEIA